jgi:S1-C subfamily serine protease
VQPGDLILAVNEIPASDLQEVSRLIAQINPGGEIKMSIQRGNNRFDARARAAERPPQLNP